jgi:hypothetical protein
MISIFLRYFIVLYSLQHAIHGYACDANTYSAFSKNKKFREKNPGLMDAKALCNADKLDLSNLGLIRLPEGIGELSRLTQ